MPITLVNKTNQPITAQDDNKNNIVIGPGNSFTGSNVGQTKSILANASITGFRVAQSMDGYLNPIT